MDQVGIDIIWPRRLSQKVLLTSDDAAKYVFSTGYNYISIKYNFKTSQNHFIGT
jgi:hypothetical protein